MIRTWILCGTAALFLSVTGCAGSKAGETGSEEVKKPSAAEDLKAMQEAKADAEAAEKKLHELRVEKARLEAEKQN